MAMEKPAPSWVFSAMVSRRWRPSDGGWDSPVAEEIGVGALRAAPDPAAQLVELRQSEGIGPVDDQRVGVGDIQAGFDDRGAEQDVHLAGGE